MAQTRKALETRERILDMAIDLFNTHGSASMSTNHLAQALGMSPGNLYYHFRNKEAIIRGILERMASFMNDAWDLPEGTMPSLESLQAVLQQNYQLLWDYRFFSRELPLLLQADPELKERYQKVRAMRLAQLTALLAGYAEAGIVTLPPGPDALQRLARGCWLIGEWWIPFLAVSEEDLTPERVQEGIDLILHLLGIR